VLPVKINGLPAHVLLIHVVVVLIPVAALMLVSSAVWPAARAKLGFLTPAVALVALVFVPITTHAGHWLQDHLPANSGHTNPLIEHHAALGDQLLPWAVGIFVMSAVVWIAGRRYDVRWRRADPARIRSIGVLRAPAPTRTVPMWLSGVVAVISIVVAVGGVVQLYRIGDSGAKAVWGGTLSQ
jgi:hypothetical protein